MVDPAEPRIRELLQATPTMAATVIAERIGWPFSIRILRDRVSELRPVYRGVADDHRQHRQLSRHAKLTETRSA